MNWLLIGASITSLFLGLYLRHDASLRIRRVGWSIFAAIVLMTVIGQWLDSRTARLHLGLIGPELSMFEAYEYALDTTDGHELQLLEAIGSYYTCILKPDSIFLRFFEWVFVFRMEDSQDLVEYRIVDSRMPQLPALSSDIIESTPAGALSTYVVYKVPPEALGIRLAGDANAEMRQYDDQGRVVVSTRGSGPQHSFAEIIEGPNEVVLSLTRTYNRPTDHLAESTVVERWNRFGDVVIYRAMRDHDTFYDGLRPIKLTLGAQEAITLAIRAGAEFEVPGKNMVSATPVYLRDGREIGLEGPTWRLPLRMSLRPIAVQGQSHRVYFVADDGQYTAYWSAQHYVPEFVAGVLLLVLSSIGMHVFRKSRLTRKPG